MKIYLDFDGTVVEHEYPNIGRHNAGSFEVIQKLQKAGHEIIINTYRANIDNEGLNEAIQYLNDSEKVQSLYKFEKRKINPHPWDWDFFKKNGVIFIDDICKGIPLKPAKFAEYDIVDWQKVNEEFEANGIY